MGFKIIWHMGYRLKDADPSAVLPWQRGAK